MQDQRPPRAELFGLYYLGFTPEGEYRFCNAHHVASYYRVSADAVLRWLEEYRIDPQSVAHRQVEIARASVDIQMDLPNLSPGGVRARVEEVLAEFDAAGDGRRPWIDGPIH